MSEQSLHQLLLIAVVFVLLVFGVLVVLHPVKAVLFLMLVVLAVVVLVLKKPHLFDGEKRRVSSILHRLKGEQKKDIIDITFHTDHTLIETTTKGERRFPVQKELFVVGRKRDCDCCLAPDAQVSGHHCRIVYRKYSHMYFLEDLRSANGTYLGTRRLEPFVQEKLLDGAQIRVGQHRFRFEKNS